MLANSFILIDADSFMLDPSSQKQRGGRKSVAKKQYRNFVVFITTPPSFGGNSATEAMR